MARHLRARPPPPTLLFTSKQYPGNALPHRPVLLAYVRDERIRSNAQLDAAHEFLGKLGALPLDVPAFEAATGVGVEVAPEELSAAVAVAVEANRDKLAEER